MKPQGNGLIELHDSNKGSGFSCMKLIKFLSADKKYSDWDEWHGAHIKAKEGKCIFKSQCDIYKKTLKKRLYDTNKRCNLL